MSKNLGQLSAAVIEQVERMCGTCDVDIVRFINNGQLELALDTSKLKSGTVAVSSGQGDLPEDCYFVDQVYLNGSLVPRNASDSQDLAQEVPGVCWFVKDTKLIVLPVTNGKYEILYIATPKELINDDDIPSIPNADEFLITYAIWKALAAIEGATERTAYWYQETERERAVWKKTDEKDNYRPRFMKRRFWF